MTGAARLLGTSLVALAATAALPAFAQDRDPAEEAVHAQEALRAKQAGQVLRAEDRVVEPFRADLGGTWTTREQAPAAPATSSSQAGPGRTSIVPWVLGGAVLAAVVAFWKLRDVGTDGGARRP